MENETKNIQFKLNKSAGFYSQMFFLLYHYIHAKNNDLSFKIDSAEWQYKIKDGWDDYFVPVNVEKHNGTFSNYEHGNTFGNLEYTNNDYIHAIHDIYVYNKKVLQAIQNTKRALGLTDLNYDALYIRKGDKVAETELHSEIEYIKLLIKKHPECKTLFVQTDDYSSFVNIQKYITDNNYKIRVITTCKEDSIGAITNKYYKDMLEKQGSKYKDAVPISEMNQTELYDHTLELIVGVDIVRQSYMCVTDYTSNVARFIKLSHNKPSRVYNILSPDLDIDYSKTAKQHYGF